MVSRGTLENPPALPVHKDPDVLAAAARLGGEDMCSIADLSSAEVRAILKLGHEVKRNPAEYRHALDAKQMVLMFEKASLRTRLAFEAGINTMGGNAIFVDQTSSPWASASPSPTWPATWSVGSTSSSCAPTRMTPSPRWPLTPASRSSTRSLTSSTPARRWPTS